MMRIGMTLAAVMVGGVLLSAGEVRACEGHAVRTEAPPGKSGTPEEAASARAAPEKQDGAKELHAAKCQCGSAADCTCKKGTCECAKCKKPRQEPAAPLEAQAPELREARLELLSGVLV
jgi:hypothetical protein